MSLLNDAQLRAELDRCEYCESKPCREACPAHCSPADFIMAARVGLPPDIGRAAAEIIRQNPLGGVCGAVCPDTFCMAACSRARLDAPIRIPDVQATIVSKATALGLDPRFDEPAESNGKTVAIIGAGPAGLAAAAVLSHLGYRVDLFDDSDEPGGACNLIPAHRLDRRLLAADVARILASRHVRAQLGRRIDDVAGMQSDYDAVLLAAGLTSPFELGVPGDRATISAWDYLSDPERFALHGPVAVVGGGAVACDCAVTARRAGAERVEMFVLEKLSEMPLTTKERAELLEHGVEINGRTRISRIEAADDGAVTAIETLRVAYPPGDRALGQGESGRFDVRAISDVAGTARRREDFRHVIVAIGQRRSLEPAPGIFVAGDCDTGPSTVVEAAASGKNAAAEIHAALGGGAHEAPKRKTKSTVSVPGYTPLPVSLEAEFFGRPLRSPLLLSAAPPTDGYEPMKRAYEAGWSGGIMKTAFDDVPIHIPSEYMFAFGKKTWANCDNVSGHPLDRVCREIERLVREYPDRLTIGSTGGPVTGDDEADARGWQSNTGKLESAGAMGIEYSLSCPQGGDGTEGDIVSQNAELTARIIEWILRVGDPNVPKLFKLTAAVTSAASIVLAVKEVLERYPAAKAGVTLANSFPSLGFRPAPGRPWEEGVIVGMSGDGVTPISNLTLAKVANLGVTVSGNAGPMNYKAAADFLALGARTVQFCTVAMKYGVGIVSELHSGLSHLMQARGFASVAELIGAALPEPVTDFMDLPGTKKLSSVDRDLCARCGNCTRCSYMAISLDDQAYPQIDPSRCIGCSICAKSCDFGALHMRERTPTELAALAEH